MNHYPSNVKEKLNSIILSMAEHHWLFPKSWPRFYTPASWETIFYDTMRLIISMGKGSTNDEIMDYFDLDPDLIPSQSAFCQRRRQISLSAFEYLFRNSLLLFHPLRTNSKTIVFSPAMGATLSMLPILILSRTIISPGLSTIKVTTTCT